MDAVAIIPALDEEAHVGKVVEAVVAQQIRCLVIDDGSSDRTAQVARAAGAVVVSMRRNAGLGRAMRRGYEEAMDGPEQIIVQLDADGQYDPAEIGRLVAPIREGTADMVLGSRFEDLRYRMPLLKRLGNRAFSWVLRRLTKADVTDGQTGFRAMHREVLDSCRPTNEFTYTQEMIIRAAKEGFRIKSVPVAFHRRYDEHSRLFTHPVSFAFKAWWIIIRTLRDYHPFRFFFWPGLAMLLAALGLGAFVAAHVAETGGIQGRLGTLTASGVLFLFAIQMMSLGMLADMIRTHTQHP